jgi:hypothetical protein
MHTENETTHCTIPEVPIATTGDIPSAVELDELFEDAVFADDEYSVSTVQKFPVTIAS